MRVRMPTTLATRAHPRRSRHKSPLDRRKKIISETNTSARSGCIRTRRSFSLQQPHSRQRHRHTPILQRYPKKQTISLTLMTGRPHRLHPLLRLLRPLPQSHRPNMRLLPTCSVIGPECRRRLPLPLLQIFLKPLPLLVRTQNGMSSTRGHLLLLQLPNQLLSLSPHRTFKEAKLMYLCKRILFGQILRHNLFPSLPLCRNKCRMLPHPGSLKWEFRILECLFIPP